MNITETLEELDRLAAQLIHSKNNVFEKMAKAIRDQQAEHDYVEKAWQSDQRLLFAAIRKLNANGIECGSKALVEAARRVLELEAKAAAADELKAASTLAFYSTDEERIDARDTEIANHIRDKERLMEKVRIIRSGNTAITPTGEIVERGTPGAMDYDSPGA